MGTTILQLCVNPRLPVIPVSTLPEVEVEDKVVVRAAMAEGEVIPQEAEAEAEDSEEARVSMSYRTRQLMMMIITTMMMKRHHCLLQHLRKLAKLQKTVANVM